MAHFVHLTNYEYVNNITHIPIRPLYPPLKCPGPDTYLMESPVRTYGIRTE